MSKTAIPEKLPMQTRFFSVRAEQLNKEARTVDLSFSSEEPVERRSFFGNYREILSHDKGAVRMDRLENGAPLLRNHDPDQMIGVVENAKVSGGKGQARVRFASNQAGNDAFALVSENVLRNVSVGYLIHRLQITEGSDNEPDEYRAIDWEPVEISLVSVPADPTVGVGRSGSEVQQYPVLVERAISKEIPEEGKSTMSTPAVVQVGTDNLQAERARVSEINGWSARYPNLLSRDQAAKFISEGSAIRDVKDFLFEKQIEETQKSEIRNLNIADLSDNDKNRYSFLRALNYMAGEGGDCYEREVSDAIAAKLKVTSRGLFVPLDLKVPREMPRRFMDEVLKRVGLVTSSATAGGNVVFTEFVSLIEYLYNSMKVYKLGATKLSGLRETVAFPRQSSTGTATWVAENPGSDVSDSDIAFAQITLSPKMLQASTSYSRKLLSQSSIDVEAVVRAELMQRNALAIDLAAINGLGSSNQPKGVLNQSGIGSVVTGGAALINDHFVDLETAIAEANADENTMAFLTTPRVRGRLKKTPKLQNTAALPIWADNGTVIGYRAEVSNQVPKTLGGGAAHGIIFGDWSQLLIGDWGVMEIIVDPYRLKKQGMIEVTSYTQMDCNVRHVESFAAITDADPNAA
jgi:HK97 family phage major capsid protein